MTTDTSMVLMVFTATMCTAIKKATIMRISSATATATIMRISMGISTVIVTIMDTDTGRLTVMAMARRIRTALLLWMQSQAWMPMPGRMREKLNSALPPAMPRLARYWCSG